jgi:hypothetical protein
MSLFFRLLLIAGLGLSGAACVDDGSGPATAYPSGGYYGNPSGGYYGNPNAGYYGNPRGGYYGNSPYYGPPPRNTRGEYNSTDGRRYTTVRVTNVGQNGHPNHVVNQKVVCGSTYYDGYQTQRAPSC